MQHSVLETNGDERMESQAPRAHVTQLVKQVVLSVRAGRTLQGSQARAWHSTQRVRNDRMRKLRCPREDAQQLNAFGPIHGVERGLNLYEGGSH